MDERLIYPPYLPDGRRYVKGTGPLPCNVLFLGESPGKDEDDQGLAFVGKTGQTCDVVWEKAGWKRDVDMRIENVLRYKPELYDQDGPIQQHEIERDRPRLLRQFAKCRPRYVFAMGAVAGEVMLGEWLRERGFEFRLEWAWGLAFKVPAPHDPQERVVVVPSYHPAAGFHDPSMAAKFWMALLAFTRAARAEFYPAPWHPDEARTRYTVSQGALAAEAGGDSLVGVDTEWLSDKTPYCATFSTRAQTSLVYAADVGRAQNRGVHVLHNAAADIGPLEAMGYALDTSAMHDTMIAARVLGEPGGLKALATRHLGMAMQDYNDVLAPAREVKWRAWLRKAKAGQRPGWRVRAGKGWSLATYVNTIYKAAVGARVSGKPFDIEKRWRDAAMPESYRTRVRAVAGPEPTVDLRDVDEKTRVAYACRDAEAPRRLWPRFEASLAATDSRPAYDADLAMVPVLSRIRRIGMAVNRDALRALEREMEAEEAKLATALQDVAGRQFNPASPDDVARLLHGDLGQPVGRRTAKTGRPSTEDKQLRGLQNRLRARKAEGGDIGDDGERALRFLDLVIELRHIAKLRSTNVTGLWSFLDSGGRFYPDLRMEAASGRCVAGGKDERGVETPNALAVPKHSPWAKKIRRCYEAGEGRAYVVVDLDQIEMRVMADLSGDEKMKEVFDNGRDIHAETAVFIFNTQSRKFPDLKIESVRRPIPESTGNSVTFRDASKTIGFGMLYGLTEYGGQEQMAKRGLLVAREEVGAWIESWLDLFPGVRDYRQRVAEETRECFYSATRLGRRRYLPWICSPFDRDRAEAERQAVSQRVQGGAIEWMKLGIAQVWPWMEAKRRGGLDIEIVLTVHDELDIVTEEAAAEEVGREVARLLCSAIELRVPVKAGVSSGESWGGAK